MLRIIVELWPLGDESKKETLGIMNIINDGTGTKSMGNYSVKTINARDLRVSTKIGEVLGFPRKKFDFWQLIIRSLLSSVGYKAK